MSSVGNYINGVGSQWLSSLTLGPFTGHDRVAKTSAERAGEVTYDGVAIAGGLRAAFQIASGRAGAGFWSRLGIGLSIVQGVGGVLNLVRGTIASPATHPHPHAPLPQAPPATPGADGQRVSPSGWQRIPGTRAPVDPGFAITPDSAFVAPPTATFPGAPWFLAPQPPRVIRSM